MEWKWSHSVVFNSLWPHGLQPTRLLHPWDFPGKSTGVGCHFLLQRIFLTQGSNLGLSHCRQTLYHLSHQGRPSKWSITFKNCKPLYCTLVTCLILYINCTSIFQRLFWKNAPVKYYYNNMLKTDFYYLFLHLDWKMNSKKRRNNL